MNTFDLAIDTDLTTKNAAYEKIYNAIVLGHFKPGERLLERELSKKLGVSRTPIREALVMLEKEHFVKSTPYKGVTVVQLSRREAWEIYNMRQVLEGMAAKLAAERNKKEGLDEDIRLLKLNVEQYEAAIDSEDHSNAGELNLEFHMRIIDMAQHSMLKRMIRSLQVYMGMLAGQTLFSRGEKTVEEHARIVAHIERGDGEAAQQSLAAHMVSLWEFIQDNYK